MAEPITIRTGLPGHGKTLNAIIEIDKQAHDENRLVYYHNITDLQTDKLKATWFVFENPLEWFKLPESAIIVIDEAQRFFPVRDPRQPAPDYITQLETIRHNGHEIVFITQDHRLLDVNIRRLCGRHIHFQRLFGTSKISRYEFQRATDFDKPQAKKDGEFKIIKLDKRFFNVYKSAVSHHFKFKLPTKFLAFPVAILISVYCMYSVFKNFNKKPPNEQTLVQQVEAKQDKGLIGSVVDKVSTQVPVVSSDKKTMTVSEYIAFYKPRIKNLPHTAPAYDEVTKPVTYPKLSCIISSGDSTVKGLQKTASIGSYEGKKAACQCFTQQGSKYKTDFEFCLNVVENGYFDAAKPDGFNSTDGDMSLTKLAKKKR